MASDGSEHIKDTIADLDHAITSVDALKRDLPGRRSFRFEPGDRYGIGPTGPDPQIGTYRRPFSAGLEFVTDMAAYDIVEGIITYKT